MEATMRRAMMLGAMAIVVAGLPGADSPSGESSIFEQSRRLSMLGRVGEAEALLRKLKSPLAKASLALLIFEEDPELRARGIRDFDPALASRLAKEAFPLLERDSRSDAESATVLASLLFYGIGVDKDRRRACTLWKWAASKGNRSAMLRLGLAFRDGEGIEANDRLAFDWIKRSADSGNTLAMNALGELYSDGRGIKANPAMAQACWEKSAAAGDFDGMLRCSEIAMDRAGKCLDGGDTRGAETYMSRHESWLKKASDAGDADAMRLLAFCNMEKRPLAPKAAFLLFRKSAESGLAQSLLALAGCFYEGYGCDPDPDRAEQLIKQAKQAALRDSQEEILGEAERVLAKPTRETRRKEVLEVVGWPSSHGLSGTGTGLGDETPLFPMSKEKSAKADALPREMLPSVAKLVLTDVVITPAGYGDTVYVDGRVRNTSGENLAGVEVNVSAEDRNGGLLGNSHAYLSPDPIPPGGVGSFKAIDSGHPGISRVTLDFMGDRQKPIVWVDRSGKRAHP
jgi:TPR repeat protein